MESESWQTGRACNAGTAREQAGIALKAGCCGRICGRSREAGDDSKSKRYKRVTRPGVTGDDLRNKRYKKVIRPGVGDDFV